MRDDAQKSTKDIEWKQRTLCRDESCIGVVGPDGKCRVCGRPYEGEPGPPPADSEKAAADSDARPAEETAGKPEGTGAERLGAAQGAEADADEEWEKRRLCSDESCIGVIGSDGRCKECGRPYEGDRN
jgi:hypothetical protein